MTRSVLTAGLLSIAALGLGIMSAQAAPVASQLSGLTSQTGSTVEKTHWRRDWRWHRHHRHYRHHYYRRWW
jgi:hypothetical protein